MNGSERIGPVAGAEEAWEPPAALPALDACELFHCLVDEREVSVTLGFDLCPAPPAVLEHWGNGDGGNAFEFFLTFTSVAGLRVSGWGGSARRTVRILRAPGPGGITVTVESPTEHLAFRAEEARLTRARTYLAATSP